MQSFNKLWVAIAGALAAIVVDLAQKHLGMDLTPQLDTIVNGIISLGTAAAVYVVPNKSEPMSVSPGAVSGLLALFLCVGLSVPLSGCSTQPVRDPAKVQQEPTVVKSARAIIDESNTLLTAVNMTIDQNISANVWTKAEAQGYLDRSKDAGKRVDEARKLLTSDPLAAENQAKLLQHLVTALHAEVAARARRKP